MPPKKPYSSFKVGSESDQVKSGFITGYIISSDKLPEDDFDEPENNEFDAIILGKSVEKTPTPRTKVGIQTVLKGGRLGDVKYIRGRFPIVGKQWFLTVEVKFYQHSTAAQGVPVYRLRTDFANSKPAFREFIINVLDQVADQQEGVQFSHEMKELLNYVKFKRITNYMSYYYMNRFIEFIQECSEQPGIDSGLSAGIKHLINYVHSSTAMNQINIGLSQPHILLLIPVLLPRHFTGILDQGKTDPQFLKHLQIMLSERPWELAFSWKTFLRLSLFLPEVIVSSYEKADVWAGMEQPYKDAVMMYHVLKEHCFDTGDTYMSVHRLRGASSRYRGYFLSAIDDALEYMNEVKAIRIDDDRIYLKRLWDAEQNIAEHLAVLTKRPSQLKFETNFEEEPLDILRDDLDQRKAVEMISRNAVTVISGKGGCGKTEVVARSCQVALEQVYKEREEEHRRYCENLLRTQRDNETIKSVNGSEDEESDASKSASTTDIKSEREKDVTVEASIAHSDCSEADSDDLNRALVDYIDDSHVWDSFPEAELSQLGLSSFSDPLNELVENNEREKIPSIPDKTLRSYILLTAPTGKAAKVLGKRTGYIGLTLHQVMWKYKLWAAGSGLEDPPFCDVSILVVDECSLVAVSNLSYMLTILGKVARLQKIIFLGDLHQLPSIEPGNFFIDVYKALKAVDCAVTLTQNHRSEGRLIVENAVRISVKQMPVFRRVENFCLHEIKDPDHADIERDNAVREMVKNGKFQSDRESQFVAFRRMDCEAINNICSKLYINELCIDCTTKLPVFLVNMKICCTKNGTVPVLIVKIPGEGKKKAKDAGTKEAEENSEVEKQVAVEPMEEPQPQLVSADNNNDKSKGGKDEEKNKRSKDLRMCNGEIYWIRDIITQQDSAGKSGRMQDMTYWQLETEDGILLSVKKRVFVKECKPKPAWCRTIHTYQGSEIAHLGYIVGAAGRQNWQHVYTAVTRGKKSVSIIAQLDSLRKAINTPALQRFCSLEEKLLSILGKPFSKLRTDTDIRGSASFKFNSIQDGEFDDSDWFSWNDEAPSMKSCNRKRGREQDEAPSEDAFAAFNQTLRNGFTNASNLIPTQPNISNDTNWFSDCSDDYMIEMSQGGENTSDRQSNDDKNTRLAVSFNLEDFG